MTDISNIKNNLAELNHNIEGACKKVGRDPRTIKVVAVTKTVEPEIVSEAVKLGMTDLGENRLQEALTKIALMPPEVKWHFIGRLQTNKVRDVIGKFYMIHSLDRLKLAREINICALKLGVVADVLVQVNVSGEKTKSGLDIIEVEDFLAVLRSMDGIRVRGMMTMAPYLNNSEEARPVFRELNNLRERMRGVIPGVEPEKLSMGMSGDYQVAIEEGADIIRVGSLIFEAR